MEKNVTLEYIYSQRVSSAFNVAHSSASCHELHQFARRTPGFFFWLSLFNN